MTTPADLRQTITAVLAGDRESFRRLVQRFELGVRSYLCSQIYRLDVVDDLAQETFLAAYDHLAEFDLSGDFAAWLRGIARHKVLGYFRSSQRQRDALERFRNEVVAVAGTELEEAAREDDAAIEALLQCIAQLPERLRTVVRAGLDGEKPAALAASLKTSTSAVYTLHWRANALLRTCVEQALQ